MQTRETANGDEAKRVERVDADARCYWLFRYRAVVVSRLTLPEAG